MDWYDDEQFWSAFDAYIFSPERMRGADAEVGQVLALAGVSEGAGLDLCCGPGRHAVALARRGFRVTGVDRSDALLARARAHARDHAEEVEFVREDMRAFVRRAHFDLAVNLFTSFGYFDDAGNAAAMRSIAGALKPGGMFLLDFLNAVAVEAHLVPESSEDRDGRRYHVRRRIEDGRVVKDVVIEEEGLKLSYSESVRLYPHHDLIRLLKGAGLSAIASYGGFDARDFTTDAPRCILVARKTREA